MNNDHRAEMQQLFALLKRMRSAEQAIPNTFANLSRALPPAQSVVEGNFSGAEVFQLMMGAMDQIHDSAQDYLDAVQAVRQHIVDTVGQDHDGMDTGYKWVPGEDS